MNEIVEIKLCKSTYDELRTYVDDFELSVNDVILKVMEENKTLKSLIEQKKSLIDDDNTHYYEEYKIQKLPKGKILVTKNGYKISNMKKVLIEAGNAIGMDKGELDPDLTTYMIGRSLFKHLQK